MEAPGAMHLRAREICYEGYSMGAAMALKSAQSGLSCHKTPGQPAGGLTAETRALGGDPPWLLS